VFTHHRRTHREHFNSRLRRADTLWMVPACGVAYPVHSVASCHYPANVNDKFNSFLHRSHQLLPAPPHRFSFIRQQSDPDELLSKSGNGAYRVSESFNPRTVSPSIVTTAVEGQFYKLAEPRQAPAIDTIKGPISDTPTPSRVSSHLLCAYPRAHVVA
jgi:hypothetical protein